MGTRVTRVVSSAVVVLVAAGFGSACNDDSSVPGGQPSSAAAGPDGQVEQRRGGRAEGSVTLGDLNRPKSAAEAGAPFDPCGLSWEDFPAGVRPADGKPHKPSAQQPRKNDPFEINCVYDNSGAITLESDGSSAGPSGGVFAVSVIWSASRLVPDASKHKGSTAKSWNDRPGLIKPFTDRKHGAACLGLVMLSKGVGGVSVRNSRFRSVDPCAVVDAVLAAITAKAS